jgi:anaerobic selenocysteine-containing dehydrogenase
VSQPVVHKTCNLCEAMCGLRIHVDGRTIRRIEADPDDPISHGAICPKAVALGEIQEDPDRLRRPLRRRGRDWEEIGWDEALGETAERLAAIQSRDGNDAVATYLGNPGAHNLGVLFGLSPLGSVLSSRNRFTASSLDQNPKHASSILLFGNFLHIPIPDIDRTQFLLVLGANPVVSGGSLMSAPGFRKRLRALQERGGKLVVVDPRRSETAQLADEHHFIRPGDDALLLATLLHVVIAEKLGRESAPTGRCEGAALLTQALAPFPPEAVAETLGMPAATLRRLAHEFAAAPSAVCYGRVGTCQNPWATLASWLIDVLNIVTGNLDRPGGGMFPAPAADLAGLLKLRGAPGHMAEWKTRVRGAPCFNGEAPTACLAEEITTPGQGQIRGLLSIAGNPVLSAPNGRALDRALSGLEFYAAVDFYLNETTRHADVILPPSWSLEHDNYELLFHGFAVRNTARYSPVVIEPEAGQKDDWEILSELALRLGEARSRGWRRMLWGATRRTLPRPSPRRMLDWMLRAGPYGDGFRPWRKGLRLADLEAAPSGLDLGPLGPRLDDLLGEDGRIDLAPPVILAELRRLQDALGTHADDDELLLIGRRDVRSNNSWLHNTRVATRGRERCTLQMHPDDAERLGLDDAESVRVTSRVGSVEAPLELSGDLRPGVVSLPHGWGHRGDGIRMGIATAHAGVSCNDLVDDAVLEPVVGNAVFNGVAVRVESLTARAR